MFRRLSQGNYASRFFRNFSTNSFISQSLRFVPKSNLSTYFENLKPNETKSQSLLSAIRKGDANHLIFSDPDCQLYLLNLAKHEQISFEQCMTVSTYLTSLMQYTDKQKLRPEDSDVKKLSNVSVHPLTHENKLTDLGKTYLENTLFKMEKIGHKVCYDNIKKFIINLPPTEQWLLSLDHDNRDEKLESDPIQEFILALIHNIPFLYTSTENKGSFFQAAGNYYIPSFTLINYFLKCMSPMHLKPYPIFGSVSINTLNKLHEANLHPVSLYSTSVFSNQRVSHEHRCGPLLNWLHDIGHTFWGSMLTIEERNLIFTKIIPKINGLITLAKKSNDAAIVNHLNAVIERIYDFDLTNISTYQDKATRLQVYLSRAFTYNKNKKFLSADETCFEKIGTRVEDRIFYLVSTIIHQPNLSQEESKLWKNIIDGFNTLLPYRFYRNTSIINALTALSSSRSLELLSTTQINWEKWISLFKSCSDATKLWNIATTQYHDELLELMSHHHLQFFPPYLPLTDEKRSEFITYMEKQISSSPHAGIHP